MFQSINFGYVKKWVTREPIPPEQLLQQSESDRSSLSPSINNSDGDDCTIIEEISGGSRREMNESGRSAIAKSFAKNQRVPSSSPSSSSGSIVSRLSLMARMEREETLSSITSSSSDTAPPRRFFAVRGDIKKKRKTKSVNMPPKRRSTKHYDGKQKSTQHPGG